MGRLRFVEGAGRALGRLFLTTSPPSNVAVPTFSSGAPFLPCTSVATRDGIIATDPRLGVGVKGDPCEGVLVLKDATVESIDLPGWAVVFVGRTVVTGRTHRPDDREIKCRKIIVTPDVEVNFE